MRLNSRSESRQLGSDAGSSEQIGKARVITQSIQNRIYIQVYNVVRSIGVNSLQPLKGLIICAECRIHRSHWINRQAAGVVLEVGYQLLGFGSVARFDVNARDPDEKRPVVE